MAKNWKPREKHMGEVTKWFEDKGYGFIRCYDDGVNYFCHARCVRNDERLVRESVVEFEIIQDKENPDKIFAYNVLVCETPDNYSYDVKRRRKKKRK